MSAQTTLTEDAPLVLDATCSDKKIWPRFANIRMDVRKEVKPDIVADARYLPFRTRVLSRIYCDPPHFIRRRLWEHQSKGKFFASVNRGIYPHEHFVNSMKRYGCWKSVKEWNDFVEHTNDEFARCLKEDGVLEYKIADGRHRDMTQRKDLDVMNNFEVLESTITRSPFGKTPIHWLILKPKPCQKQ